MAVWGTHFSTGDQGENKKKFWENNFQKCPQCGHVQIQMEQIASECRMNGDSIGTTVFE